eukprot:CAMPEP_0168197752 /NCGR_PEP_ID=MMETSP0139_2-20121125/21360_1 /TAXON_ID=44445 /ORGANISM="Pseudo-nitzschia australis, Strain 10249 10 AB" /LENGTH=77 /DNA_ID=CAMNT_0008122301 /DNA_START=49 /DNA_END=279 /DNA_ORIENTATION=-
MASSRWKRFAFFEKNALSLPSEVLEDLLPTGGESSNSNSKINNRRSANSLSEGPSDASPSNNKVSLAVTTAALPLDS